MAHATHERTPREVFGSLVCFLAGSLKRAAETAAVPGLQTVLTSIGNRAVQALTAVLPVLPYDLVELSTEGFPLN